MKKAERDLIMRQQVVLPVTPRERRELEALQEDLRSISISRSRSMYGSGPPALAEECAGDAGSFEQRWYAFAEGWTFNEVNDLIDRHNRWYPVESRLPMDPKTGDYLLVSGRDYRLAPLAAEWVLERFSAELPRENP